MNLLRVAEVALVVDIRTVPRSRTNPDYNSDVLPETLSNYQIAYEHSAELGGLRGKSNAVPPEVNGFWNNQVSAITLTAPFRARSKVVFSG